eukprot:EG_transcript_36690
MAAHLSSSSSSCSGYYAAVGPAPTARQPAQRCSFGLGSLGRWPMAAGGAAGLVLMLLSCTPAPLLTVAAGRPWAWTADRAPSTALPSPASAQRFVGSSAPLQVVGWLGWSPPKKPEPPKLNTPGPQPARKLNKLDFVRVPRGRGPRLAGHRPGLTVRDVLAPLLVAAEEHVTL